MCDFKTFRDIFVVSLKCEKKGITAMLQNVDLRNYLQPTDNQLQRIDSLLSNCQKFAEDPDNAEPMFLVFTPEDSEFTMPEQLRDPAKMMKTQLDDIKAHLDIGDDTIPALRVEFGTGKIAHAYGCEIYEPEDNYPSVKSNVLKKAEDVENLVTPGLRDGFFGLIEQYYAFLREHAPDFVRIQLPDLQGPFNNAYLLRGDDIFLDLYDKPDLVDKLLDKVTDYHISQARQMQEICGEEEGFFCDWNVYWKGNLRICNCAAHMISTEFYKDFIRKYDQKILDSLGGGRMHYCGTHDKGLLDSFFTMDKMYGLDFDGTHHDLWEVSAKTPKHIALSLAISPQQRERLISGDWPDKRNIILQIYVSSKAEGIEVLKNLRDSVPK